VKATAQSIPGVLLPGAPVVRLCATCSATSVDVEEALCRKAQELGITVVTISQVLEGARLTNESMAAKHTVLLHADWELDLMPSRCLGLR